MQCACFEHSNFFKVNDPSRGRRPVKCNARRRKEGPLRQCTPLGRTDRAAQKFNYELFDCSNFSIRYWSWNYRGCWHQTCPPIDTR